MWIVRYLHWVSDCSDLVFVGWWVFRFGFVCMCVFFLFFFSLGGSCMVVSLVVDCDFWRFLFVFVFFFFFFSWWFLWWLFLVVVVVGGGFDGFFNGFWWLAWRWRGGGYYGCGGGY